MRPVTVPDGRDGQGRFHREPCYLSLITNQGLRTIVIIGRPDFNAPDWRNNVPGHPMTDQQITDVVAWLAAQRPAGAVTASPAYGFCFRTYTHDFFSRRTAVSEQDTLPTAVLRQAWRMF